MVSLTSPDGLITVEEVTNKGTTFHLPPWIKKEEFISGMNSGNDGEPLSSLVGCTLVRWEENYDYDEDDDDYDEDAVVPIFKVNFRVPFDSMRELVANRFTPTSAGPGQDDYKIKVSDNWVEIEVHVEKYQDFNDVQAVVLPKDFADKECPSKNEWLKELFNDLVNNFEEVKKYADGPYRDITHNQKEYFLLLKTH